MKELKKSAEEENRVKFLQEAVIMGQFNHNNVVKLYGVVTIDEPVSLFSYIHVSLTVCNIAYSVYVCVHGK